MTQQRCCAFRRAGFLVLLAVASGCHISHRPSLQGSGVAKSETRAVGSFTEIELEGQIELDLSTGPATDLNITGDDNLLPHIKTEVTGDKLKIYADTSYSSKLGIQVSATAPALKALTGSGATKSTLSGVLAQQFSLDLSGACSCRFTGDADRLVVNLSGASHITLVGASDELVIECSGASKVDAMGLTAKKVRADVSGASTGLVNASDELRADASGASTLRFAGKPVKTSLQSSGASTVSPQDLKVEAVELPESPESPSSR